MEQQCITKAVLVAANRFRTNDCDPRTLRIDKEWVTSAHIIAAWSRTYNAWMELYTSPHKDEVEQVLDKLRKEVQE